MTDRIRYRVTLYTTRRTVTKYFKTLAKANAYRRKWFVNRLHKRQTSNSRIDRVKMEKLRSGGYFSVRLPLFERHLK